MSNKQPGRSGEAETARAAAAPAEPAIEIDDLSFSYGDESVLDGVSARIGQGEYWSIIGPNGAGKTTLLKCLLRIQSDWSGAIRFFGRPIERYPQRDLARRVSYVPQAGGRQSFPFNVHEFVLMGRYPHLSPFSSIGADDEKVAREAMERTGVARFAERSLDSLSGGERQKVYIAAALAQGGDVMILDEPTSFLDYRHQSDVLSLLRRINVESGVTIVSVTHDVNCALRSGGYALALKTGRVEFQGKAWALLDEKNLERVFDTKFHLLRDPETDIIVVSPQEAMV